MYGIKDAREVTATNAIFHSYDFSIMVLEAEKCLLAHKPAATVTVKDYAAIPPSMTLPEVAAYMRFLFDDVRPTFGGAA